MAAWTGLQHPNVLPFIGSVTLGSKLYIVSPWMENGDVLEYLRQYPERNRVKLLLQIAMGLEYLHTFDPVVVHGDLKGNNVLVSRNGDARIADFGLSYRLIENIDSEANSSAWYNAGNARWKAPELLRAESLEEALRTTMSDMYAFGRVIFEVFTMKRPFAEVLYDTAVVAKVLDINLPVRPMDAEVISRGLDDRMWKFMKHCCDKHPSRRLLVQDAVSQLHHILQPQSDTELPSISRRFPISLFGRFT